MSCANAGAASDPATIKVAKNKTLRGKAAGLTKGSLDGPTMTPSRLLDSQTRSSMALQPEEGLRGARCGPRRGPGAVRGPPAAQLCRWLAGAGLPQAVAPSRRDFDPLQTRGGPAAAPAGAPVREPAAAWALRSDVGGGVSPVRCATSPAMASARRAAQGEAPDGRPTARAQILSRDRCVRCAVPGPVGALRRQRTVGSGAGAVRAFADRKS